MSRTKKKRAFVHQYLPADPVISKQERLADENSYESRKKRALDKKKKHKSVYQKAQEREQTEQNSSSETVQRGARGGRLVDKIRKLNQQKDSNNSDA